MNAPCQVKSHECASTAEIARASLADDLRVSLELTQSELLEQSATHAALTRGRRICAYTHVYTHMYDKYIRIYVYTCIYVYMYKCIYLYMERVTERDRQRIEIN